MDRTPATKRWPRIAAYLALLAAFNLFCFLGQSRRNDVFWLCYSFVTLAFGVRLVSLTDWLSPHEGDGQGLPLVRWYFWGALAARATAGPPCWPRTWISGCCTSWRPCKTSASSGRRTMPLPPAPA